MTDHFLQKHHVLALERSIDQTGRVLENHLNLFGAKMTIAIQKAQIKGFKYLLGISIAIHVITGVTTALMLISI